MQTKLINMDKKRFEPPQIATRRAVTAEIELVRAGDPVTMDAGLVQAKRIKRWTFYKRDEARIKSFRKSMKSQL